MSASWTPLDPERLAELRKLQREDGEDVAKEIGRVFLASAHARIVELRRAVSEDDAPGVEAAAHTLKSGAATIGASRLSRICEDLEEGARSGRLPGAAEALAQIERHLELVAREIEML